MALIDGKQTARLLGVSVSYLYIHPEIPRYKLPNSSAVRFDEDEVLAWAKSQAGHGAPTLKVVHRSPKYRQLALLRNEA